MEKFSSLLYYNYLDSKCEGKGIYIINIEDKKNTQIEKKPENYKFELSNDHVISYDNHGYNIINNIIKDINTLSTNSIKNKLKNYFYLCNFIKAFAINHINKPLTINGLLSELELNYGKIEINYYETINEK